MVGAWSLSIHTEITDRRQRHATAELDVIVERIAGGGVAGLIPNVEPVDPLIRCSVGERLRVNPAGRRLLDAIIPDGFGGAESL